MANDDTREYDPVRESAAPLSPVREQAEPHPSVETSNRRQDEAAESHAAPIYAEQREKNFTHIIEGLQTQVLALQRKIDVEEDSRDAVLQNLNRKIKDDDEKIPPPPEPELYQTKGFNEFHNFTQQFDQYIE